MGCLMVAIVDSPERPPALEELPVQLEAWEQALSRFRSDSELCELNCHPGEAVAVSQVLWDVFQTSREAEWQTGGLVNPLIADSLVHAGYTRSFDEMLAGEFSLDVAAGVPEVPSLGDVIADPAARTICLPSGSRLDFGGVAKGWTAHQAMLGLSSHGSALFSAGGDIAISGPRPGDVPWEITVDDPFQPGSHAETLYVERGGVATSGKDYRTWMRSGVPQHHIIDPRTGLPAATDVLTATVLAPSAMLAEAFAKYVVISGSEAGLAWLDSDDSLAGLIILDNGQRLHSRNLASYL